MKPTTGWAVFSRHGIPIISSVRLTRSAAINWWVAGNTSKKERKTSWLRSRKNGFTVRRVSIQELISE